MASKKNDKKISAIKVYQKVVKNDIKNLTKRLCMNWILKQFIVLEFPWS